MKRILSILATFLKFIRKQLKASFYSYSVNNAVYKTGFATTQAAYDENITKLFKKLDELEDLLAGSGREVQQRDYLVGDGKGQFTEADLRWATSQSCNLLPD